MFKPHQLNLAVAAQPLVHLCLGEGSGSIPPPSHPNPTLEHVKHRGCKELSPESLWARRHALRRKLRRKFPEGV